MYVLITVLLITLLYVIDTEVLFISTLVEIIGILIFIFATLWRLNDMGWPKWWALGILILFVLFYIDYELITMVGVIVLIGIIVVLSYLPANSTKKLEVEEIKNNIMIKNKIFNKNTIVSFILGMAVMFGSGFGYLSYLGSESPNGTTCFGSNVGVVRIFGEIGLFENPDYYSTSEIKVIQQIEELDGNSGIKAIVLDISSSGGGSESSENIMLAVQRASKPVVAVIRTDGASGAYKIASAADRIYANRLSDVGSIGTTIDILDTSEKDRREGVVFYDFSSGPYKATYKDHNKITQEQRDFLMEDVMKSHDIFVEYVAKNRNIPLEKVKAMATGRTYMGDDALKLGLIDQIGGMYEAGQWLEGQIGEEPSYCYVSE